jgi:hypothetical protein
MPTSLTGSKIRDTYGELLHLDGGVAATEKSVLTGAGAASALKVGTSSASVGNVRLSGSTVAVIDPASPLALTAPVITGGTITGIADLAVADGGTGASNAATARTNLGLVIGTDVQAYDATLQSLSALGTAADRYAYTTGVDTWAEGTITAAGRAILDDADAAAQRTTLGLGTMATQAANSVAITGGTVSFGVLSGRAFGSFSDITDQTGSTTTPTAVKFGTNEITGNGISVVTDGANLTRITFTDAGTYMVAPNLQFYNSENADHDVTVWLRKNGTDIARSATKVTVPKATDGGSTFFQIVFYDTVTAGQYIEIMWLPEHVNVTIDHTAAVTGPPAVPAIPSAIVVAERIA